MRSIASSSTASIRRYRKEAGPVRGRGPDYRPKNEDDRPVMFRQKHILMGGLGGDNPPIMGGSGGLPPDILKRLGGG